VRPPTHSNQSSITLLSFTGRTRTIIYTSLPPSRLLACLLACLLAGWLAGWLGQNAVCGVVVTGHRTMRTPLPFAASAPSSLARSPASWRRPFCVVLIPPNKPNLVCARGADVCLQDTSDVRGTVQRRRRRWLEPAALGSHTVQTNARLAGHADK